MTTETLSAPKPLNAVQVNLDSAGEGAFKRLAAGLPGLARKLGYLGADLRVAKIDGDRVVVEVLGHAEIGMRQAVIDVQTLMPQVHDQALLKRFADVVDTSNKIVPLVDDHTEEVGVFLRIPGDLAKQFPDKSAHDASPPHVTMLYVGKLNRVEHTQVVDAVKGVMKTLAPTKVQLTDYGEFRNHKGETIPHLIPRAHGPMGLEAIQQKIQAEVEKAIGRPVEQHPGPWKAHATLAYVPPGESYTDRPMGGEFTMDSMEVWGEAGGQFGSVALSTSGVETRSQTIKGVGPDWYAEVEKRSLSMAVLVKSAQETQDEHTVLGIVLEPETVDSQNDIYSEDEIRKTMYRFMERYQKFGLMHRQIRPDVFPLECFQAPMDFPAEVYGQPIKKGTWLMRVRVENANIWKDVKTQKLTGFSIGGSAIRRPENRQAA